MLNDIRFDFRGVKFVFWGSVKPYVFWTIAMVVLSCDESGKITISYDKIWILEKTKGNQGKTAHTGEPGAQTPCRQFMGGNLR